MALRSHADRVLETYLKGTVQDFRIPRPASMVPWDFDPAFEPSALQRQLGKYRELVLDPTLQVARLAWGRRVIFHMYHLSPHFQMQVQYADCLDPMLYPWDVGCGGC
jgi:hypothetical protein